MSWIPRAIPSGEAYAAGVDGTENGVLACAGVDGVDDRPGNDCRWSMSDEDPIDTEADVDPDKDESEERYSSCSCVS